MEPSNRDCQCYLSLVYLSLCKPQQALLNEPLETPMQRAVQAIAQLSLCRINEAYNIVVAARQDYNDSLLITLIKAKIEQVHHRVRT